MISKTPLEGEAAAPAPAPEATSAEAVATTPSAEETAAPIPAFATTLATESGAAGNHDSPASVVSSPSTVAASEPASVAAGVVETSPAGNEGENAEVTGMPNLPTRPMSPGTCVVHPLARDPLAVEAEYLGGPGFGQLTDRVKALATPPLEFCATLSESFKVGEPITVQGPLGPITVEPPPEAEAGMSLRYQLVPRPDFRVQVPTNTQPGTEVRFDRGDGIEISMIVPKSLQDDAFEVTPPALMVKAPEGSVAGMQIAFRNCSDPEETAEWFGLTLPEGCQPGKYVTAKLPHPKKRSGIRALKSQAWEWKSQAIREIKGGSLQLLRQLQRPPFDRAPLGELPNKNGMVN